MVKAIFFDVDGTLLHHGENGTTMPSSTRACLHALHNQGIRVFVATGRFPAMTAFMEDYFHFDGYITLNGQLAVDREGNVLHRRAHDPEDIRTLIAMIDKDPAPFPCLIIEEDRCFYVQDSPVIRDHFAWAGLPAPGPYDIARLDTHPVLQFLAYILPEEYKRLSPLHHIDITGSGHGIADIIPDKGGKEVGIAAVAAHYGWKQEEIMVFGDGPNDAKMLSWAGIGVAMGNGVDEAKAAADYVTTPVDQDGVKNALLHFGILDESQLKG